MRESFNIGSVPSSDFTANRTDHTRWCYEKA